MSSHRARLSLSCLLAVIRRDSDKLSHKRFAIWTGLLKSIRHEMDSVGRSTALITQEVFRWTNLFSVHWPQAIPG